MLLSVSAATIDRLLVIPRSGGRPRRRRRSGTTPSIRRSVPARTHPDEPVYTFWDYLRQAWERNAGMRLDHILLSGALAPGLRETGVDAWVRGVPGASDHAPTWANLETNLPS